MTVSDFASTPARDRLKFLPEALAEWNALDGSVKEELKRLLKKRLEEPRLPDRAHRPGREQEQSPREDEDGKPERGGAQDFHGMHFDCMPGGRK